MVAGGVCTHDGAVTSLITLNAGVYRRISYVLLSAMQLRLNLSLCLENQFVLLIPAVVVLLLFITYDGLFDFFVFSARYLSRLGHSTSVPSSTDTSNASRLVQLLDHLLSRLPIVVVCNHGLLVIKFRHDFVI